MRGETIKMGKNKVRNAILLKAVYKKCDQFLPSVINFNN